MYFGVIQLLNIDKPIFAYTISLFFHLLNIWLIYELTGLLYKSKLIPKFTVFFYSVSPIHFFALGWVSAFQYVILITWSLLFFISFVRSKMWQGITFLILALGTNELSITLPVLGLLLATRKHSSSWFHNKKNAVFSVIVVLMSVIYVGWRLWRGLRCEGDYQMFFSIKTMVGSLRWYFLWILGWSDIVRDYVTKIIIFRNEFFNSFPEVVIVYFIELMAFSVLALNYFKNRLKLKTIWKDFILWIPWTIISLSPVLFFSQHLYSGYATLASLGVYWFIAKTLSESRVFFQKIILIVWLAVVVVTMRLNYLASWMSYRARDSVVYQQSLLRQREKIPADFSIYIVTSSENVKVVMAEGYGVAKTYGIDPQKVMYLKSLDQIPRPETERNKKELNKEELMKWWEKNKIAVFSL